MINTQLTISRNLAVFSKSYCPYCNATKQLLSDMKANYYAIELDLVGMLFLCTLCLSSYRLVSSPFSPNIPSPSPLPSPLSPFSPLLIPPPHTQPTNPLPPLDDGSEIQNYLKQKTNQSSVPNIFIGEEHIGGNSDLQAKGREKLETQLKALNVIQGEIGQGDL